MVRGTSGQLGVDDLLDVLTHESAGALLGTVAERLDAVSALQDERDLPPGQGHELVREVGEAGGTHVVSSDRMLMTSSSVKPRRHQDEVRVEVPGDGHHHGPEGGEVLGVPHGRVEAPGPGDVDVGPEAEAGAALDAGPGARVEVPVVVSVDADVEHSRVFVECFLCLKWIILNLVFCT